MHYQISRNGQMYGPYTFEDLQRYLASGNVLPTDLAKSETMTEWVPVSQILSGGGAPPSASRPEEPAFSSPSYAASAQQPAAEPAPAYMNQPYNPPAAQPPYQGSAYSDAPDLHWGLYLLFTILTCALFSKVFTVIQAAWLKKVQPNSNGLICYIGLYVLWVISLFVNMGHTMEILSHHGDYTYHGGMGRGLFTLIYFIVLFVTRFVMSASLEEHFNGPEPMGLRMNPVMVFLFGGVYFQAKLNEINAIKRAARYGAVRPY